MSLFLLMAFKPFWNQTLHMSIEEGCIWRIQGLQMSCSHMITSMDRKKVFRSPSASVAQWIVRRTSTRWWLRARMWVSGGCVFESHRRCYLFILTDCDTIWNWQFSLQQRIQIFPTHRYRYWSLHYWLCQEVCVVNKYRYGPIYIVVAIWQRLHTLAKN